MNRIRSRLAKSARMFISGTARFFPSFILSVLLALAFTLELEVYDSANSLCIGLIAALFASVPATLAMELCGISRRKALCVECAASLLFGALFGTLYHACTRDAMSAWMRYDEMALVGFLILCAALSYVLLMERENEHTLLLSVLAAFAYAVSLPLLLMALLAICLLAFQTLIHPLPDLVNELVACLTMIALPVSMFLVLLPRHGEKPKLLQSFVSVDRLIMALLSAVYMGLLSILLLYVGKIVITRQMPVGEMNWYASFALLYCMLLWLMPAPRSENAACRLYARFGGWLLLPVIAVQVYGIGVRFAAYGLTTPRYVSMVCLALGVFALALTLLRRSLRPVFIASIAAIVALSFTPLNAIDVPAMEQEARLHRLLAQNDLLSANADGNGESLLLPDGTIPVEARKRILSCVNYLRGSASLALSTFWKDNFTGERSGLIDEILGASADEGAQLKTYYYQGTNQTLGDGIDVSGYTWLVQMSTRNVKSGTAQLALTLPSGEELSYDLTVYFDAIVEAYGHSTHEADLRIELDERSTLLLSYLEVRYDAGHAFQRCQFSGVMLVR